MRDSRTNRLAEFARHTIWRRPDNLASILIVVAPLLVLAVFGLIHIISGYGVWYAVALLAYVAVMVILRQAFRWRRSAGAVSATDHSTLLADKRWGPFERQVFSAVNDRIRERTQVLQDWDEGMFSIGREIAEEVAHLMSDGRKNTLDVTIPELLGLLEQVNSDCREFVRMAVISTALRQISVNNILWVLRNRRRMANAVRHGNHLFTILGMAINPPAGAVRMLGMLIDDKSMEYLSEEFQIELQRRIMCYVAAKSVDLYSGRFRVEAPLADLRTASEPIKILLFGQTGAGKSALRAALSSAARNPAQGKPGHSSGRIALNGIQCAFVEAPGIGRAVEARQRPRSLRRLLRRRVQDSGADEASGLLLQCDMVIWVVRADQPGRKADAEYFAEFRRLYDDRQWRLAPPLLVAVTHVDSPMLIKSWPQDRQLSPAQRLKIDEAVRCVGEVFSGHSAVPVKPGAPAWGLDELVRTMDSALPDACHAQNNRLRTAGNAKPDSRPSGQRPRRRDAAGAADAVPGAENTDADHFGHAGLMGRLKGPISTLRSRIRTRGNR